MWTIFYDTKICQFKDFCQPPPISHVTCLVLLKRRMVLGSQWERRGGGKQRMPSFASSPHTKGLWPRPNLYCVAGEIVGDFFYCLFCSVAALGMQTSNHTGCTNALALTYSLYMVGNTIAFYTLCALRKMREKPLAMSHRKQKILLFFLPSLPRTCVCKKGGVQNLTMLGHTWWNMKTCRKVSEL